MEKEARKRPLIERDYLRYTLEMITPTRWQAIVEKNIQNAEAGDPKARDWIARLIFGKEPKSLSELALREALDISAEDDLAAMVDQVINPPKPDELRASFSGPPQETLLERALRLAKAKKDQSDS